MSRRDQVIDYVADRYGRDRVSQIITFGSLAAKAVVRDVGRVLGLPYGFVDGVAKLIPFELGITLEDALEKEPELTRRYGAEDEVRDLIDLARRLEGLARNAGTHAGGVVIAPRPLTDFTALYCEAGSPSIVTQFDKDDVEQVGPRQVRLPRPAHAHDHRLGHAPHQREAPRRGRGADRPRAPAARRRGDLQAAEVRPHDRDLPARVARHHGPGAQAPARPLRRHRRAGRPVPPRAAAVRHGGRLHRPQARPLRRHDRLPAPEPRRDPEADLRRDPVPGTGHADRADPVRLHAGRRRPAAPCDGQEEARGDGAAALGVRRRRGRARRARGARRLHLRPDREVRRLRLQQVALGRLCAARLPDGLAEGALPRGLHGGRAVLRHGAHGQGRVVHRRMRRPRHRGAAARRQRVELRLHRRRPRHDPLRPRRDQGRGRGRGRGDRRRARARRRVPRPASTCAGASTSGSPASARSRRC